MLLAAQHKEHNTALWLLLPNASHRSTKGLDFLPSNTISKARVTTSRRADLLVMPSAPAPRTFLLPWCNTTTLVGHKAPFEQL